MARRHILFDKTELVVIFPEGKSYKVLNLQYSDIQRIQIDPLEERKFLSKVPSEKISIVTGKRREPIVYTKLKEKQYWEEYKEKLAAFAQAHSITFRDNTTGSAP